MVVFLLTKAIYEVLDEDEVFAIWKLLEVIFEIKDLSLCDCSAFLR